MLKSKIPIKKCTFVKMYVVAVNSQNGRDKGRDICLKLVKHFYESLLCLYTCVHSHMIQAILSNVTLALNLA